MRVWAIEMQVGISQEAFYARIYKKQKIGAPFARACRNAHGHVTRAIVRLACPVEMHMDISQETIYANLRGQKMPRPKIATHSFCASLRTQNAHGHVTKAISCENLPEEDQGSESVP